MRPGGDYRKNQSTAETQQEEEQEGRAEQINMVSSKKLSIRY